MNYQYCLQTTQQSSLKAGNEKDLCMALETVAFNVNSWFHANRLIPNLEKSEFVIYGRSSRAVKRVSFKTISIGASSIKRMDVFRYLGIYIDSTLSFKAHINKLDATVSRNLGCLHRVKFLFPYQIMRKLYFSLVGMLFSILPDRLDVDIPFTFTKTPNCPKQGNKNPWPFFKHTLGRQKNYLKLKHFLFLDILHLQQIFHLNIGIWFLEIQRRDNFSIKWNSWLKINIAIYQEQGISFFFLLLKMRYQD